MSGTLFKKGREVEVGTRSLMRNRDIKAVKRAVRECFPSIADDTLSALLPGKKVEAVRLSGSRIIVYVEKVHDQPVFFDVDGRGDIYPTTFALWRFPDLLPHLAIPGRTSGFLVKGADLMMPGVWKSRCSDFAGAQKGDKWAVTVVGQPLPIAVGCLAVAEDRLTMPDCRGKALLVKQVYGDGLWKFGGGLRPNVGFQTRAVLPTEEVESDDSEPPPPPSKRSEEKEEDKDDGSDDEHDGSGDDGDDAAADVVDAVVGEGEEEHAAEGEEEGDAAEEEEEDEEEDEEEEEEEEEDEEDEGESSEPEAPPTISRAEMDEWIMDAVLLSLKNLTDDDIPVSASVFLESFLIPNRRPGTYIDFKASSFKQVSKLLRLLKKQRLVKVNEKKGQVNITRVLRNKKIDAFTIYTPAGSEPHVNPWVQYRKAMDDYEARHAADGAEDGDDEEKGSGDDYSGDEEDDYDEDDDDEEEDEEEESKAPTDGAVLGATRPSFCELYRPTPQHEDIFEDAGEGLGQTCIMRGRSGKTVHLYSKRDLKQLLTDYCEMHELEHPRDRAQVCLNEPFMRVLFPIKKMRAMGLIADDGTIEVPAALRKGDLAKRFLESLEVYHGITAIGELEPVFAHGKLPMVDIVTENRGGRRKHLTHVRNLASYGLSNSDIASAIQRKCACSATTQPSGEGGEEILCQGDVGDTLASFLVREYNLPQRIIKVSHTGKSAKGRKKGGNRRPRHTR
eukprot:PLAT9989.1.p1 GENE.PLAT9989.1~~PLAT9989.1.p1  ORF type:complete len:743 (-),score=413.85 PLAT9989.1:44-2233(-)